MRQIYMKLILVITEAYTIVGCSGDLVSGPTVGVAGLGIGSPYGDSRWTYYC